MTKQRLILQRIYEIGLLISIGVISQAFKTQAAISLICVCAIISGGIWFFNVTVGNLLFAATIALLSWGFWTLILAVLLINYLDAHFHIPEHSWWDILALFGPVILAVLTLIWALRKRIKNKQFDGWYMIALNIILVITTFIDM